MRLNKGMFTSSSNEYSTPQKLFDELNKVYNFTLDPCATKENAKCKVFYTKEDDGLSKEWYGRVFMNPPYGRIIGLWIKKAYDEVIKGNVEIVVCLLPARTDTRWFQDYCLKSKDITWIRGRVKFNGNPAPFPSCIVIFKKDMLK